MIKKGLHYLACLIAPHIMLVVGLIYLSRKDAERKALGKRLCILSTIVLILGSLAYYIFFTPIFGLD
jgi:4-amino-4-deoxy-L-arabinose transferase-like glycosyltransferase